MGRPRILFVCTANICRSPTAEHLARRQQGAERFTFSSAGLLRAGTPCPDRLLQATGSMGVDLSAHQSRLLDRELLAEADLVVTMEVAHLREITVLDVDAFAKTVPFLELDRMLRRRPRTLPELLDELARRDPATYLSADPDLDVPDPYGRSSRAYATAVAHIGGLVRTLTSRLLVPDEASEPAPGRSAVEPLAEEVGAPVERSASDDPPPAEDLPTPADEPAPSGSEPSVDGEPDPTPTPTGGTFVWRRFRRQR